MRTFPDERVNLLADRLQNKIALNATPHTVSEETSVDFWGGGAQEGGAPLLKLLFILWGSAPLASLVLALLSKSIDLASKMPCIDTINYALPDGYRNISNCLLYHISIKLMYNI